MASEVYMPKMSDHMEAGEIIRWLVREGDRVESGQPLLEMNTDKTVTELEAPASGVLKGIRQGADEGALVPVGVTIAFIAAAEEQVPELPPLGTVQRGEEESAAEHRAAAFSPSTDSGPVSTVQGGVKASPAARRLSRELGVELERVRGSGSGGRITEQDVRAHAAKGAETPDPGASEELSFEWEELTPMQQITARRMAVSAVQVPQYCLSMDVDMSGVVKLRRDSGGSLSITAFLIRAVARALAAHRRANASFANGKLKIYKQVNIGVAVGTDQGLVVPVIKQADEKNLKAIAEALAVMKEKKTRFSPEDLAGGTFTVSNLGMYGIDRFDAMINPPQSAILAAGRIVDRPVGSPEGAVTVRPLMTLSLSVDHRVMDGAVAAGFLAEIVKVLQEADFE
jgi:pyruvate dehydrogenase E2 component (dihydrolipoamide acetyltransferase)